MVGLGPDRARVLCAGRVVGLPRHEARECAGISRSVSGQSARMSATISHPSMPAAARSRPLRFGAESGMGEQVRWLLKRNCSVTPRQMMGFYASLCAVSLVIAAGFWVQGATLVVPFTSIEVIALGIALALFARHAGDREDILLKGGRLTVEC